MDVAKIEYGIVQELKKEEEKIWSELQLELAFSCKFASLRGLIALKKQTVEELEELKKRVVKNTLTMDKVEFMEMCIEEMNADGPKSGLPAAMRNHRPKKNLPKRVKKKVVARRGRPRKVPRHEINIESLEEDEDVVVF